MFFVSFLPQGLTVLKQLSPWQVFPKLLNGAVKYDELYAWLILLLVAGSEFDTSRRQENKPISPVVRT